MCERQSSAPAPARVSALTGRRRGPTVLAERDTGGRSGRGARRADLGTSPDVGLASKPVGCQRLRHPARGLFSRSRIRVARTPSGGSGVRGAPAGRSGTKGGIEMESVASVLYRRSGEAVASYWRSAPGFEAHHTRSSWCVLTGEPFADFNMAMVHGGETPEDDLREIDRLARRRDAPYLLFLAPALGERLAPAARALGLTEAGRTPLMAHRTGHEDGAGDFRVEVATDEPGWRAMVALSAGAFDFPLDAWTRAAPARLDTPGLTVFVAYRGDEPVSTVTTTEAGGIVGVWTMGTPPELQRRGAGRAVLTHALRYHRQRGCDLFYLLATPAGQPLYASVGFTTVADLPTWVRGHSTQV
jgi:GNAT superfamily N-acetyltransferase